MGKLVVTAFVTLDGVMEAPEKWCLPYWSEELDKFKTAELLASDALLMGRVTYQAFATRWPLAQGKYADRLNRLPKYVVSRTMRELAWNNSHLIHDGMLLIEEVSRLKNQLGRNILVHGSRTLVQNLIKHDLVDEYNLLIHPIVLGKGAQLFTKRNSSRLKLIDSRMSGSGVALLTYAVEKAQGVLAARRAETLAAIRGPASNHEGRSEDIQGQAPGTPWRFAQQPFAATRAKRVRERSTG